LNVRAFSFELKVFQSVDESAPVVVEFARERERVFPESESQFGIVAIPIAPDPSVRMTSPVALTERNLLFPERAVDAEVS
jgi:hypothetical protein